MVTITHEASVQTEARLRGVFRDSAIRWLAGSWCFREDAQAAACDDAIAEIRDEGRLSALCPATDVTDKERFAVFRVVLPSGVDDSGFVGWLSSRIKAATGSGVFVICGHNQRRGGVFDYYGVPQTAIDQVRDLLDRLGGRTRRDDLDGVVMAVRKAADTARIGLGTVFCFDQEGGTVTARYGGGPITHGWLAGTIDPDTSTIHFRYLQVGTDGATDTGESTARINRIPDGRWQLTEQFTWQSRPGTGINHLEEVISGGR
jgi:hypothetical protein